MFALTAAIVASLASTAYAQATFTLDCGRYPEVNFASCDNHCNAFTCHGFDNVVLHRDITAADTGDDNRRRTAIGCGDNNYCPTGTECDEYPYASTFDGGVGASQLTSTPSVTPMAIPAPLQTWLRVELLAVFLAIKTVAMEETLEPSTPRITSTTGTHCEFYSSNTRRPALIADDVLSFVALPQGPNVSPLCDALATQGDSQCPDESDGIYRFRTTPATPSCPSRGSRRRSILSLRAGREESKREVKVRTIYTDANQTLSVYGQAPGPKVGGTVWTPNDEGGFHSTIVKVEE
ncbi:hypothetical protein V5O48_008793 [Marasmius crinis-equi]|uniref:Deoxyribonuclease NucA/NucB domain-containing protein n=1 Tax=Marasmius crinis-equi TaxID=585013 RepID=A0ABR3FD11_9AGAR